MELCGKLLLTNTRMGHTKEHRPNTDRHNGQTDTTDMSEQIRFHIVSQGGYQAACGRMKVSPKIFL